MQTTYGGEAWDATTDEQLYPGQVCLKCLLFTTKGRSRVKKLQIRILPMSAPLTGSEDVSICTALKHSFPNASKCIDLTY
eukprot:212422-Rhodomonas_salina.5